MEQAPEQHDRVSSRLSRAPQGSLIVGAEKNKDRFMKARKSYDDLDYEVKAIQKELLIRQEETPITVAEEYDRQKVGVERQLEVNDTSLAQLLRDGTELITNIRIANDKREVDRRNKEAELREELLEKLQQESVEAQAKFDNISSRWKELDTLRDPMGIYEGLEYQKKRIDTLMQQKDAVIEECRKELDAADLRYVIDQEKQSCDISCLVERIDNQINIMKMAYRERLDLLETAIDTQRDLVRTDAATKFEEFQEFCDNDQQQKCDKEKERPEAYAAALAQITEEHEEIIRATRIRLEQDNEELQVELENLKGNVLLNSDKFDYNYQVLQKREEENVIIRNQQKRRLTRLNETVNSLKKRMHMLNSQSQHEVARLKNAIKGWRKKILDLEDKADSMLKINDTKYQNVWRMNHLEASKLLEKVLSIDKVIYEQQLGLKWEGPAMDGMIRKESLASYVNAEKVLHQLYLAQVKTVTSDMTQKSHKKLDVHMKNENESTRLMRTIFRSIADNSGFLIESKLNDLLEPFSEIDQTLVRIDNVFYALGIKRIEDVLKLQDYFSHYAFCPNCFKTFLHSKDGTRHSSRKSVNIVQTTSRVKTDDDLNFAVDEVNSFNEVIANLRMQSVAGPSMMKASDSRTTELDQGDDYCGNHYYVIDWGSVLTALRDYVEEHISTKRAIPATTMSARLGRSRSSISRLMARKDVQAFWEQFLNMFPNEKEKLWNTVEQGLMRYIEELKKREALCRECDDLKRQNNELKFLMQRYMPQPQSQ